MSALRTDSRSRGMGLFLRRKPFLHAASSIKHRAAHTCSWRSYAKRVPTVERALIPLQLSSEFFSCHKFCEDRYQLGHGDLLRAVARAQVATQRNSCKRTNYRELRGVSPPIPANGDCPHCSPWRFFAALIASMTLCCVIVRPSASKNFVTNWANGPGPAPPRCPVMF